MQDQHPHGGISMHQLRVGGNFPGFVFAIGSALIFLLAIPALWYVVAGAIAFGLLVAAALQLTRTPRKFISINAALRSRQSILSRIDLPQPGANL